MSEVQKRGLKKSQLNNLSELTRAVNSGEYQLSELVDCTITIVTPLCHAVDVGNFDIVKYLIRKGAPVDGEKDVQYYFVPIFLAAKYRNRKILSFLLKCGANTNIMNDLGYSVLTYSVENNRIEIVECLLQHDVDVNNPDAEGRTALSIAADQNNLKMAKCLLKHGAGCTIQRDFIRSIAYESEEMFKLLLENGADVNDVSPIGHNPLLLAIKTRNFNIGETLFQAGAKFPHDNGTSLLCNAIKSRMEDIVRLLLDHGANVNGCDDNGNFPIITALEENNFMLAKILIEKGAKWDLCDSTGYSSLTKSVEKKKFNFLHFLVNHGADVNKLDKNQNSALAIAVSKKNLRFVKFLVEHNADVSKLMSEIENIAQMPLYSAQWKSFLEELKSQN